MMGSIPLDTYTCMNIKQRLEEDPDNIVWTSFQKVSIKKGETGKLGIKVKTFQGKIETFTIVTLVKSECCLIPENTLGNFDRIIAINGKDIHTHTEEFVLELLQTNNAVVELTVCRIDLKRDRDSSGSEFSGMSGRPLVKVKPVEHEESDHFLSPDSGTSLPDSPFTRQCYEAERVVSVPVLNSPSEMIQTSELYHSLDSTRKPKTKPEAYSLSPCISETFIKYPQCVKWSETKTVTLDKGGRKSFGFTYKIKQCKQEEWYTLVVEVKDLPAEGKLMVGDFIRSINGTALTSPKQTSQMMDELNKCTTARIVLQRPDGLVQNFKGQILQTKDSASTNAVVGATIEPVDRNPKRQNSCTSQKSLGSGKLFPAEQKPTIILPSRTETPKITPICKPLDNNALVSGLFNVERPRSSCSTSNESHMNLVHNEKLVDNSEVHLIVQETPIFNNNNQILHEFQTNRTVKLPKIRIFICGNEARTLAKILIPSSFLQMESSNNMYDCVKCTMGMSKGGDVSFMSWSSYENLLQSEETTRLDASNDSLANGDIGRHKEEDYLHRGLVNTEIFIVSDEKFFQYCCQYLFTRTSLFLLTFNCAKVLNSAAAEILRLQNMIHSIRCCVGYDCNIMTYGLVGNEHADLGSPIKDEVRTLFYTPYGQQIRKYNVTIPDLILPSVEENGNQASSNVLKKNVWRAVSETIQKQLVSVLSVVMMRQLEDLRQEGKQIITDDEFTKLFKMAVPNGDSSLQHVVWTHLMEFGEILSPKAAPLNLPNNQNMDKLLFIDPEIILQHVQCLICMPQRFSFNSDIIKHYWSKLVNTGNISRDDILSVISSQSVNSERILKLVLAFGIIFKHFVDQDRVEQYFFPYFLSENGNLETHTAKAGDACLHLQFKDQIHMSSMQFFQLAFGIGDQSDSKKISVTSATSCCLQHQGHDIILMHYKFEDRMQIILKNAERNKKLFHIYQWFSEICNVTLAPEIQYVLGPECPLHEKCQTGGPVNNLHIVDISRGSSILCKTARIEKHPSVKRWLQDQGIEPKVYIMDLPYSVFHKLFTHLQTSTTLGQDWRELGGLLGLTLQDIQVYETKEDPAKLLLIDQNQTNRLTVHELIELLNHESMKRKDLIELLQNWLDSRK